MTEKLQTSADGSELKARAIRSFVKRTGRKTEGQRLALEHYWPLYGLAFEESSLLDLARLFPAKSGVKLEIGFGNGDSLVQMAQQDVDSGYIGIEVHTPGVGHCLKQLHDAQLSNLRLISHDAIEVLESMIPAQSIERVFLFFPDPWHKKRHHKRRIVNRQFRDLLIRVLKPGGVLHMATDWQHYAEHMAAEMLADTRFANLGDEHGFSEKPDYRPDTKFERRGLRLGHGVWDLVFVKV
ncbi:MAG: tRNA (guanosine(46)-N7)-methyltransferase TrmB [Gammaproteobacteria bacterium]|nr:tRNA (guanosine(46)-N7)-methyltransferase TrmB [Gammaproteobacteria bacterium]MBL6999391.1 tRNA (guanosine(46)-N7)-methyltransferase TrmB [Gammaproteobacteria bacterium]